MKVNQLTIEHIKQSEGLRLEAYPDPGSKDGKPVTIGYGTTRINGKAIDLGTKITRQQAEAYLKEDIEKFADGVLGLIKVRLTTNQFGALVSFAYNIGLGAFQKSTLLRKLNLGDLASVPSEMRRWNKNDGKVMQGLINRREKEIALWNTVDKNFIDPTIPLEPAEKPVEKKEEEQAGKSAVGIIVAILLAVLSIVFGREIF